MALVLSVVMVLVLSEVTRLVTLVLGVKLWRLSVSISLGSGWRGRPS